MVGMMTEEIPAAGTREPAEEVARLCGEFVAELTGKQTIYQMIRLNEEIRKRGGETREPLWYKRKYLARLMTRLRERLEALRSGRPGPRTISCPARSASSKPSASGPADVSRERHGSYAIMERAVD